MDTRGGAPQFCLLMFSGLMWFIKPATLSSTHPVHPATGIVRYEVAEKCVSKLPEELLRSLPFTILFKRTDAAAVRDPVLVSRWLDPVVIPVSSGL